MSQECQSGTGVCSVCLWVLVTLAHFARIGDVRLSDRIVFSFFLPFKRDRRRKHHASTLCKHRRSVQFLGHLRSYWSATLLLLGRHSTAILLLFLATFWGHLRSYWSVTLLLLGRHSTAILLRRYYHIFWDIYAMLLLHLTVSFSLFEEKRKRNNY